MQALTILKLSAGSLFDTRKDMRAAQTDCVRQMNSFKRESVMDKHQRGNKAALTQPQHHDRDRAHQHHAGHQHCSGCGAYFSTGRWSWQAPPADSPCETVTCPACRRIAEHDAAGNLSLSGAFLQAHRTEIVNLIRHTEAQESKEHALERLIDIADEGERLMVSTTGTHLANRIAHALEAAYDGTAHYTYTDNETHLDVSWKRD